MEPSTVIATRAIMDKFKELRKNLHFSGNNDIIFLLKSI